MRVLTLAGALAVLGSYPFMARAETSYTWESPDQRFEAVKTVDMAKQTSSLRISLRAEPTQRPVYEEFGGAPAAQVLLDPPVRGFWSPDSQHLFVVSAGSDDHGHVTIGGDFYDLGPFISATALPRFEHHRQVSPDLMVDDGADLVAATRPIKMRGYGGSGMTSALWNSQGQLKSTNELDFSTGARAGAQSDHSYSIRWDVTYRVDDSGFTPVAIGPIRYSPLDARRQPGHWYEFPRTDQDRLRIAVRLNQADIVAKYLAQGIRPDDDHVANLCTIAANRDEPNILDLLIKNGADVNRQIPRQFPGLAAAVLSRDSAVFDLWMGAKVTISPDNAVDAYFYLLGFYQTGVHEDVLSGKATPDEIESQFSHRLDTLHRVGFDINSAGPDGSTFLMGAVKALLPIPYLQKLLAVGADPRRKNKAGQTSADIAFAAGQLPALRLLDVDHHYAKALKDYAIPADSAFVGTWKDGDGMFYVTLAADGSGTIATLFNCTIMWKISEDTAQMEIHPVGANRPIVMKAEATLSQDGKQLFFKSPELGAQTLDRTKL